MVSNRKLVVVALVVLVALAGCAIGGSGDAASGGGGDGGDGARSGGGGGGSELNREAEATASGQSGGRSADDGGGVAAGGASALPQNRAIIRTGQVELEVQQFDPARREVVEATRAHGGYVAGSAESVHRRENRTWTTGSVRLRVPSENFSAVFGAVKGTGQVRSATSDTTDVTDKLVDLRARLSNLRAQRDRLRTLYNRTNETSEILEVAKRLSAVQSQIERLEARQRSLENRVAYSTITVRLAEPRPEPTPTTETAFHETGLVEAVRDSVDSVVVTLRSLAVAFAYALPYLAVFGTPLALVGLYLRRR